MLENIIDINIICQCTLIIWFFVTHFISLPPLNDLTHQAFINEKRINVLLIIVQLAVLLSFALKWHVGMLLGTVFWSVWLIGHLCSWWLPYFFGWPTVFLENAVQDNARTYHFLPARKNHPIPDLAHCILGILSVATVITCLYRLL